jgi:hypothetical protein
VDRTLAQVDPDWERPFLQRYKIVDKDGVGVFATEKENFTPEELVERLLSPVLDVLSANKG